MKRTFLWLLLILGLSAITLAGCQNPDRPSPKDPVTLTMWHNYGGEMQRTMDTLVDEFNSTVGKEQGITIDVAAISSSAQLNESLIMIANGDPGAPALPDIFTGYPKIAAQLQSKGLLCNLDTYFTAAELSAYVDEFVAEGRLADGGLYVFPLAKSTEVLYLNQTLFDRFAAAVGAQREQLSTFEGIAGLARQYYAWTDAQTPDTPNDGKTFYTADSWFNLAEVGMAQLDSEIFDANNALSLRNDAYAHIFNTLYKPTVEGGFAIYNGYSSDLSKTGDIVCSTGSSAGILFYGDTVTYADGTVEKVEYSILPYPTFAGSKMSALQRGGGLMAAKTTAKKEQAAAIFLKWLTAPPQNMRFIAETGYLPVTVQAFETEIQTHLQTSADTRIKKMLTAVLSMYEHYSFFTAPNFNEFDEVSKTYEKRFKALLQAERAKWTAGKPTDAAQALVELTK